MRLPRRRGGEAGRVGRGRAYPAVEWRLFGVRGRPWGPVVVRVGGDVRVVYYAFGEVLRRVIALGGGPVGKPQETTLDAWLKADGEASKSA